MTAVFLFPLLWVIGLSLKTRLQVFAMPPLFVWWPTLENYVGVLGQADFLQAFVNSLVVSSGAVILSICVGVPAAYAFARFPVPRRLVPVLLAAGHAHAAADRGAGADVHPVQQARPDHDAAVGHPRLQHVQPAAGGVDHARLLRGPAARTGGKRLGGWRIALCRIPPRGAAADPAGTGGGEHPVVCSLRGTTSCSRPC